MNYARVSLLKHQLKPLNNEHYSARVTRERAKERQNAL